MFTVTMQNVDICPILKYLTMNPVIFHRFVKLQDRWMHSRTRKIENILKNKRGVGVVLWFFLLNDVF